MKRALMLATFGLALSGPGCQTESQKAGKEAAKETRSETEKAAAEAGKQTAETREEYTRKAQGELDRVDRRITELENKLKAQPPVDRKEADKTMADIQSARAELEKALVNLKAASQEGWTDARGPVDRALDRLHGIEATAAAGKAAVPDTQPAAPEKQPAAPEKQPAAPEKKL